MIGRSNERWFYLQALPIHAKTGRESSPERLLAYGSQDDEF
jgi:hypothetical protein